MNNPVYQSTDVLNKILFILQNVFIKCICMLMCAAIAQPVQQLATGWTVWVSNSGGSEIFRACPDWPWGPPSLLYNGCRVFFRGKTVRA